MNKLISIVVPRLLPYENRLQTLAFDCDYLQTYYVNSWSFLICSSSTFVCSWFFEIEIDNMWCIHVWLFLLLLYDHFWSHFAHSCEFIEINWLWWKAQTWGSYHHQPWATKAYGSWFSIKIRIGHYLWHACWMVLMFSSCVLFLLFIQVFLKCQASSYEKACTRIRRWAHLGLCPHIENAQRPSPSPLICIQFLCTHINFHAC